MLLATGVISAQCVKEPAAVEYETRFINASSLYVRERPDPTAAPVALLPYGTRVETRATTGADAAWYAVKKPAGFISARFVQAAPPAPKAKRYVLKRLDYDGCAQSTETTLELSDGIARLVEHGDEEGGIVWRTELRGSLSVTEAGLRVAALNGTRRDLTEEAYRLPDAHPCGAVYRSFCELCNCQSSNLDGYFCPDK